MRKYNQNYIQKTNKETKICKKINIVLNLQMNYGRLVIPIEIRRKLDIQEKDAIEIYTASDTIILKKFTPTCLFCNNEKNLLEYKGKLICENCSKNIKNLI